MDIEIPEREKTSEKLVQPACSLLAASFTGRKYVQNGVAEHPPPRSTF
jgi:hypothetical protein